MGVGLVVGQVGVGVGLHFRFFFFCGGVVYDYGDDRGRGLLCAGVVC